MPNQSIALIAGKNWHESVRSRLLAATVVFYLICLHDICGEMTYSEFLSAGRCSAEKCGTYAAVAACSYRDEWSRVPDGYEAISKWGVEGFLEGNKHYHVSEDGEITSDPHFTTRKATWMTARMLYGPRGEIVVSFRGTDNWAPGDDLGDDLGICKGEMPLQCIDAARLLRLVLIHSHGAEIIVVGHSLGGSLVQCAIAANDCHGRKVSGYVFNSMGIPSSTIESFDANRLSYANENIFGFQMQGDGAIGLAKWLVSVFQRRKMQFLGMVVHLSSADTAPSFENHKIGTLVECLELGR